MKIYGNAASGNAYQTETPVLPRAEGPRAAHKPWCVDCKKKHDAEDLDRDGRCEKCARAAVRRAEAAARRAADGTDQIWEDAQREFKGGERRRPGPRPEADRALRQTAAKEPKPRKVTMHPRTRVPGTRTPAGPVQVRRTVDHSTRIRKLEERRDKLREQLNAVTQEITSLRAEHGTARVTERRTSNVAGGPQRMELPADEIVTAYQAGATLAQLAAQHGCSSPTIARTLDDAGVVRRGRAVDYTAELLAEVRRLYVDEQLSQAQVADQLDLSVKVIQTAMEKGNIPARESAADLSIRGVGHPVKIQPEQHDDIVARYQAGESAPAIAAAYEVSAVSIYYVLRKHGVTDRHHVRSAPGHDGSKGLRQRMADLGTDSRTVKLWAIDQGLLDPPLKRGIPSMKLVDAWAAAHHPEAVSA